MKFSQRDHARRIEAREKWHTMDDHDEGDLAAGVFLIGFGCLLVLVLVFLWGHGG